MLFKKITRGFKESSNLSIYQNAAFNTTSGISATIFGATGFMGNNIAHSLGKIGSDLICPSKALYSFCDNVKDLRLSSPVGFVYVNHHTNFNDPKTIRRLVEKSNVVINLIGPRRTANTFEAIKQANIDIPRKIARESRLAGVKRLIHFSNVAVDPNSPSMDLATKYEGERVVLEEFPDATIFRLTTVIGDDDYFMRLFRIEVNWFNKFLLVYSDLEAKRQPILMNDVCNCVTEVLKLPESKGQIYEIGGPHTYELKEIYDFMINLYNRPISYAKMNKPLMMAIAKRVSFDHFSLEDIVKQDIDMSVTGRPGLKSIGDLYYKPASIMPSLEWHIRRWSEMPMVVKDDEHS